MEQRATKLNVHEASDGGVELKHTPPSSFLQLTEDQFRALLSNLAKNAGSRAELGRRLDLSGQHIDAIVTGRRKPGPSLLAKLGARKIVLIEVPVEEANGK